MGRVCVERCLTAKARKTCEWVAWILTDVPTVGPTVVPRVMPTVAPTVCPCLEGGHGCDEQAVGVCNEAGGDCYCMCASGWVCVESCLTAKAPKTCAQIGRTPCNVAWRSPSAASKSEQAVPPRVCSLLVV